jgi:rhombotail lipoprotein
MPVKQKNYYPALLVCLLVAASGCAGLIEGKKTRHASSVVDFLYPDKENVTDTPSTPELTLPMNVGIAFVPATTGQYSQHDLDANQKMDLMERIAKDFRQYEFIRNIEFIPTEYLRPGGSFDNLDQISTMYGVDVMALISYDQVQYTDEGLVSLTYWTIVGAYIFKGEKNDTSTMVDAAVYDIASRKMLFRAPGVSQVKGAATFVNQSEELREDSRKGFELAADALVVNLQSELDRFKEKIRERPETVKVVHSKGYTGGGYSGAGFTTLFLLLAGIATWRIRRHSTS